MIIGAYNLARAFVLKRERRLSLEEELLSLVVHIEGELLSYMRTIPEAISTFKRAEDSVISEHLKRFSESGATGMLKSIRESVCCEVYEEMCLVFSEKCLESLEREGRRITASREELEKILESEREKMKKARVSVPMVSTALAVGIAIIFI